MSLQPCFPFLDLLRELRDEVRERCAVVHRSRLSRTCHSLNVEDGWTKWQILSRVYHNAKSFLASLATPDRYWDARCDPALWTGCRNSMKTGRLDHFPCYWIPRGVQFGDPSLIFRTHDDEFSVNAMHDDIKTFFRYASSVCGSAIVWPELDASLHHGGIYLTVRVSLHGYHKHRRDFFPVKVGWDDYEKTLMYPRWYFTFD